MVSATQMFLPELHLSVEDHRQHCRSLELLDAKHLMTRSFHLLSERGSRHPWLAGFAGRMNCLASERLPFRALGPARAESMETYLSKPSSNLLSTNVSLLHIPAEA